MMKINSSQKDWILFRNVTSGNRITFDYNISAEPSYQWWVLYRGVMPDWANLNENKEKWDWVSSNSKTDRKGKVQFDYEFTAGAIYTLALFKDQTENAYDLADYFEFCFPPQDHKLYDRKISGNTTTFFYSVDGVIAGSGNIFDGQKDQWWALYRGVMPHWANLNKNKEKWDRASLAPGRFSPVMGGGMFDYEFTPGAIYTLALFKDQTENAYDLADYMEFCVQPQDDNVSHLKISGNTIEFDYNISAEPSSQWWVLYRGVMPDWANLNENKEKWDWISSNSKTDRKGKVQFDYECTPGAIYTLALFKDQTENAYDLAYYLNFLGDEQDNSADPSGWIELHGDNSYCYCACSSAGDNKQKHDSNKTMNVKEGAPYLYAVLTKDEDSMDFPTDAVLTIEGPDGTKYDRDIQEENQLVIMSGSSVRSLIVKDPKPGDWKMTMTVPEGVGFHCQCNTVPSKDPYKTITTALSKANQLQKKRHSSDDDAQAQGWIAVGATTAILSAGVTTATVASDVAVTFSIAGATLALTPLGIFFLAAAIGIAAVTLISSAVSTPTTSPPSKEVPKITKALAKAAKKQNNNPVATPQAVIVKDNEIQLYLRTSNNREDNDGLGDFEIFPERGERVTYHSFLEWIDALRTHGGGENRIAVRMRLRDNPSQSPWMRMETNFYVLGLSQAEDPWANNAWRDIPARLVTYPDNLSINISLQSIPTAMGRVNNWTRDPNRTGLDHGALTLLIFLSAEAARFDGVAFAVNALLRGQVDSYEWLNFRPMLTDWSALSLRIYHRTLPQPGVSLRVSTDYARALPRNPHFHPLFNDLDRLRRNFYPEGYIPPSEPPSDSSS